MSFTPDNLSAVEAIAGSANYEDTLTTGTPIVVPPSTTTELTCNALGALTNEALLPLGVSGLWNAITSRFDFNSLTVGSEIVLRVDIQVVVATPNTVIGVNLEGGIGGVPFTLAVASSKYFKSAGTYSITEGIPIGILTESTRINPARLVINSDSACTAIVKGWYLQVRKR